GAGGRRWEGARSGGGGQPNRPTTSWSVLLGTPGRGVPPCLRTSANASARFIEPSRPVKAILPWMGERCCACGIPHRVAFFFEGRRAGVEAAAGFLASPLRLARSASLRLITRGD